VRDKVLAVAPNIRRLEPEQRPIVTREYSVFVNHARSVLRPALILVFALSIVRRGRRPERARSIPRMRFEAPVITVHSATMSDKIAALPAGLTRATVSLTAAPPVATPVLTRNVVAALPGTDPKLRHDWVIVSAHYDAVGKLEGGEGDRIRNGANDNASGVAGMLSVAGALARLPHAPRRSILFIGFTAEEKGVLGSRYYIRHPLVPLDRTVANLDLEQLGRPDGALNGATCTATLTGFEYTSMLAQAVDAGQKLGIRVVKDPKMAECFAFSDNISFAGVGIPADTLTVGDFVDRHKVTDEADKIDYENAASVSRLAAMMLLDIANRDEPVRWNEQSPAAAEYSRAGAGAER
jgi:Zn-dependent M28 family amino/carboxypeptidase